MGISNDYQILAANGSSEPPEPSTTNGSIPIRMDPILGEGFEELAARAKQAARECASGAGKRSDDPSVQCFTAVSQVLLPQFVSGGPLSPLTSLLQKVNLRSQQDIRPVAPYVQPIGTSAGVSNLGLTPGGLRLFVKTFCWMLYGVLALDHLSPSIWDIPASALVDATSASAVQSSTAQPCPTGMFTLDCEYCNGNQDLPIQVTGVMSQCGGLANGQWKDCPCNVPDPAADEPYGSEAELQAALEYLWSFVPAQLNPLAPIPGNLQPGLGIYRVQFKQQAIDGGAFT